MDATLDRGFDVVLMDCNMPLLDGYEATARIRALEHGRRTPILAMTANDSPEDRDACLRAGMDDYLVKPIQAAIVLAAVDRWSAIGRQQAPPLGAARREGRMSDAIARLERELADARREAESATRTRSAFLAAMSHELKTPMNAVFGSARLLLETTLTPQQREHVATTLAAGETMLAIVEDAIDYAALEGGALTLAHAPFDLAAVIDAAVRIDAARADEKGLDLAALIDPALPALVVGDAARVRLIVRKLLANAITFTDTGSVLVRAAAAAAGGVRLEFEDTGVGVRAETAAHLFEAFVQGDISTTRRHGGTGLGLAICRRLAEAMGGTIGVDGVVGAGSRFWVELPLVAGDAARGGPRRRRLRGPAGRGVVRRPRHVPGRRGRAARGRLRGRRRRHGGRRPRSPHRQPRHRPARAGPARARARRAGHAPRQRRR